MEMEIGKISHYYTNIGVGVLELVKDLKAGDTIHVQGATTDFVQKVESIQIDNHPIEEAKSGSAIGIKLTERAREGDTVYTVEG